MLQPISGDDFSTEMAEFLAEAEKGLGLIMSTEKQMKDEFAKVRCARALFSTIVLEALDPDHPFALASPNFCDSPLTRCSARRPTT